MQPEECRKRAEQCRDHARSAGSDLRDNFLQTAEVWDQLADQLERIDQPVVMRAAPVMVLRLSPGE